MVSATACRLLAEDLLLLSWNDDCSGSPGTG